MGYPQYILNKAAKLNNDEEITESKYFPLYGKILDYWFPAVTMSVQNGPSQTPEELKTSLSLSLLSTRSGLYCFLTSSPRLTFTWIRDGSLPSTK